MHQINNSNINSKSGRKWKGWDKVEQNSGNISRIFYNPVGIDL